MNKQSVCEHDNIKEKKRNTDRDVILPRCLVSLGHFALYNTLNVNSSFPGSYMYCDTSLSCITQMSLLIT